MTATARYSAVIADDHGIVRSGLRSALETPGLVEIEGIGVLAEAGDGPSAIAAVKTHQPSVAILDVQMPFASGVEVVSEARRWSPESRIVVYTGVKSPGLIGELIEAGVDGLFTKSGRNEILYEQLPNILRGGRFIDESFVNLLEAQPSSATLTERERETLELIVSGHSNKDIGESFGISERTVEKHRKSIMDKLQASTISELFTRAVQDGLVDLRK